MRDHLSLPKIVKKPVTAGFRCAPDLWNVSAMAIPTQIGVDTTGCPMGWSVGVIKKAVTIMLMPMVSHSRIARLLYKKGPDETR